MTLPPQDEFHRLRTSYLKLRAALRDPNTGFFGIPVFFDDIRGLLADRPRLGVLWIGLGDRRLVEAVYGWEAYDRILAAAAEFLRGRMGVELPEGTILASAGVHSDAFTAFIPPGPGAADWDLGALAALASRLESGLERSLAAAPVTQLPTATGARIGAALLTDNPFHRFERRVYQALDEARVLAEQPQGAERLAWMGELQRVLRERDVYPVFQPLVDLKSAETVGFEAYSRGPEGSVFHLPRVMFSIGREAGLALDLDRMCRRQIIDCLQHEAAPGLLFLNTTAENLLDPDWRSPDTLAALNRAGLAPGQVVLEVPERQIAVDPDAYRAALEDLRALGYRLSLDDIGSGPHSVMLVERLRPEFIKFDLTLVRGLGTDQLRRELVRSLVGLAERARARLVAERVETDEERRALLECGALWGQGYLFAAEGARVRPCALARGGADQ